MSTASINLRHYFRAPEDMCKNVPQFVCLYARRISWRPNDVRKQTLDEKPWRMVRRIKLLFEMESRNRNPHFSFVLAENQLADTENRVKTNRCLGAFHVRFCFRLCPGISENACRKRRWYITFVDFISSFSLLFFPPEKNDELTCIRCNLANQIFRNPPFCHYTLFVSRAIMILGI